MDGKRIIEKLSDILSRERKEISIEPKNAAERFRQEKSQELKRSRKNAEKLMQKSDEAISRVEEDLEEIKDYDDADDIEAVEDVAENFYKSRKRIIEKLDLPEDFEDHYRKFEEFMEDFNDVSRKEGAVMKRVQKGSSSLSSSVVELMDHREKLEKFYENGFKTVRHLEEIKQNLEKIQELEEELDELNEQFEEVETGDTDSRIKELEEKIQDFQESDKWQKKENLEKELELLEEKKLEKDKGLKRKISKLERGLKKLIYSIENENQDFEGDFVTLKALFNRNYRKIDSPFPELEEAENILREEGMLEDRQMEKFSDSVRDLENFESDLKEIRDFERDIEKVRGKLDGIKLEDERRSLEKERKSLQEKLEERQQRMEDLRDRIEEKEWQVEKKKKELEKKMNGYLEAEIEFGKPSESDKDSD